MGCTSNRINLLECLSWEDVLILTKAYDKKVEEEKNHLKKEPFSYKELKLISFYKSFQSIDENKLKAKPFDKDLCKKIEIYYNYIDSEKEDRELKEIIELHREINQLLV